MYLLPDWFAASPARDGPRRRFGLIHCALLAHVPASWGTRMPEQNLKVPPLENSSTARFAKRVAGISVPLRSLHPSGLLLFAEILGRSGAQSPVARGQA